MNQVWLHVDSQSGDFCQYQGQSQRNGDSLAHPSCHSGLVENVQLMSETIVALILTNRLPSSLAFLLNLSLVISMNMCHNYAIDGTADYKDGIIVFKLLL